MKRISAAGNRCSVSPRRASRRPFRSSDKPSRWIQSLRGLGSRWLPLMTHCQASGRNSDEVLPQALAAAKTGLDIDPQDAHAHAIMALVLGAMNDLERAEAEFDIALRLNPGSADIMTLYSLWANAFGKPERGAEAADKAIRLNPNYPNHGRPTDSATPISWRADTRMRSTFWCASRSKTITASPGSFALPSMLNSDVMRRPGPGWPRPSRNIRT